MNVHFSSKTDLWATPQDFFDKVASRFNFGLDACADATNSKCLAFYSKEQDALKQSWNNTLGLDVWMNPPYGRGIGAWVRKAYETSLSGTTVVCLLPARTDTKWFHDYCVNGEIDFIKGRLKFGGSKNSAPFPSMLVIFHAPQLVK